MVFKNKLFILVVVLSLFLGLTQAQEGMVLRVGMPEPLTLDPAIGSNDHETLVSRHIYDYLVDLLPNGTLVPSLAESWTISDDGLTYTFTLAQGVTFHDGSDFNAADVVYTFTHLAEVGSSAMGLLGQKEVGKNDEGVAIMEPTFTIATPDDFTVVFTLEAPNADFIYGVASRFSLILPEGLTTPNSVEAGLESFNGTGAFKLGEFDAGERIVLTANDAYFKGRPQLDAIEFIFIEDANTQVDALRSGQVDFIMRIPDNLLANLEGEEGITITTVASNGHPTIRLRADAGHLGEDVRIRQAFKHATDRELLNLDVLDGRGAVGNNDPVGPVYGPLFSRADYLDYDPERSCALLAEYAAENPDNTWVSSEGRLAVDFYVVDALGYPVVAEFMQQQWADACIDVNLIIRSETIYYGNNEWMDVDLGLTGWGSRPTPQEYFNVAYITGAPYNESHWSNAEVDALAAQASQTADIATRAGLYAQIATIFEQEGPIIIPFFIPFHGAYRNTVSGLQMDAFPGRTNFYSVTVGS